MPPSKPLIIKVRPATRRKYELVQRRKRWKFVEVADAAIDALIERDADLSALRRLRHEPQAAAVA